LEAFGIDQSDIGSKQLADFRHVAALRGLQHLFGIDQ
jgi:hypothetical protein